MIPEPASPGLPFLKDHIMLRVVYDPHDGVHVADADVPNYVQLIVFEYLQDFTNKVVVGQESIIDEFRIAVQNGDIQSDDIVFEYEGKEHFPNRFGNIVPWPKGFCDYGADRCIKLITNASKMRKENVDS